MTEADLAIYALTALALVIALWGGFCMLRDEFGRHNGD